MARKVPINLYLEQAQVKRLAKLREKTKIPVSAHMRTAVDMYLNKVDDLFDFDIKEFAKKTEEE